MNSIKNYVIGVMFALLYCFSSGYSTVIINISETKKIPELLLTFSTFIIALLFFNLSIIDRYKKYLFLVSQNKLLAWKLNLTTAFYWIGVFTALKFITPMILLAINWGTVTIVSVIALRKEEQNRLQFLLDMYCSILLAIILLALIASELMQAASFVDVFIGLLIAVVAGVFGAYNNIYSRQLFEEKFSANEVLALRFYLVSIVCAILLLTQFRSNFQNFQMALFPHLAYIGFISVIIPLFTLQKSLEHITPVPVSFISSFIPIIAFAVECFKGYTFSYFEVVLVALISLLICFSAIARPLLHAKSQLVVK